MSRRNSASRRRSYGRRLHEMHERRHARGAGSLDWHEDMDTAGDSAAESRFDHLAADWRDARRGDGASRA
jgi:hypothetical protein